MSENIADLVKRLRVEATKRDGSIRRVWVLRELLELSAGALEAQQKEIEGLKFALDGSNAIGFREGVMAEKARQEKNVD